MLHDFQAINNINLPDGEYRGIWGGYEVTVPTLDNEYVLQTFIGVKTFGVPVWVIVKDHRAAIRIESNILE